MLHVAISLCFRALHIMQSVGFLLSAPVVSSKGCTAFSAYFQLFGCVEKAQGKHHDGGNSSLFL